MSKQTSKKFIILLFILLVAFAPLPVFAIFNKPQKFLISQQVNRQNSPIPVALPRVAIVTLKGGQKKSGRLVENTPQTITLYNNREIKLKTAEIKEISFQGEVILKSGGNIVIRGEDNQNGDNKKKENWIESLNNFKITDRQNGKAEITLTSVKPGELREIIAEANEKDTTYIIEKMLFNSSGRVTITLKIHRNQ